MVDKRPSVLLALLLALLLPMFAPAQPAFGGSFSIKVDPTLHDGAYTGRVYVVIMPRGKREPRKQMNDWFNPPQILAQDCTGIPTGQDVPFEPSLGYPLPIDKLAEGKYTVQAVARRNVDSPKPGEGAGDLFSLPLDVEFKPGNRSVISLKLERQVLEPTFRENERIKFIEIVSPSLSNFHGREYKIRAAVALPENWKDDPDESFPTIYSVSGFGGSHREAFMLAGLAGAMPGGEDVLQVFLDANCGLGHSVFADSANNGPWGEALTEELIPEIERRFHGAKDGSRRFVWGVSSGGWSSLWLQITYPDFFGGCWSHCPDPVDFRDFQYMNLYEAGTNFYTLPDGGRRPLGRRGNSITLYYREFVALETVLGPGGQIHSFEAVFSPRGADGKPLLVFDRATGNVNVEVAETWKKYDIRYVLENNWDALGPKLSGKVHVYAGEVDNFYLERSVGLLKESMTKLGSDAVIEIVPGMGHTVHMPAVRAMVEAAAKSKPTLATAAK